MKRFWPLLLVVWSAPVLGQGPITGFMPGGGNLDLALTYGYDSYNTYVFGTERQPLELTNQSADLFLEYGTSDRFSLLLTVPYLWIDTRNRGLQDGSFYLKFRNLYKENEGRSFSLITALGLTFPFSNYPTDTETPIGQKATAINARLNLQYKGTSGLFVFLQSGLDYRIIPDALASLPTLLRVGYGGRRVYLDAWIENYYTFDAGTDDRVQGGSGSRWWRIGGTVYVSLIPELGVVINGARFISGRNIGLSNRLGAGLVYKFRRKRQAGTRVK